MFKTKLLAAGLLALAALPSSLLADDWTPTEPVTLLIGFGPGGSTDTLGRAIASAIEEQHGWDVVVENRPGGGSVAMFSELSAAPADGLTIGVGVNMPVLLGLISRGDTLPFTLDSFDYLATIAAAPLGIVARADAPYNTFAELVAYGAEHDGALIGYDAPPQLLIIRAIDNTYDAGLEGVAVQSGVEAIQGLLGGQLQAGFGGGEHIQYIASGDLKLIATATDSRHAYAPDVTSLREQGYEFSLDPYFYIAAPAGLSDDVRATLASVLNDAIHSDAVTDLATNIFYVAPNNLGPEGTQQMLTSGISVMQELIDATSQ